MFKHNRVSVLSVMKAIILYVNKSIQRTFYHTVKLFIQRCQHSGFFNYITTILNCIYNKSVVFTRSNEIRYQMAIVSEDFQIFYPLIYGRYSINALRNDPIASKGSCVTYICLSASRFKILFN